MADIVLNLSGGSGLVSGFAGDVDMITPQPNLKLAKTDSDLVSGLFNPYLRENHLAPVITTATSLTLDTTPGSQLTSVEYDYINSYVYWGDSIDSIYVGSSLTDTSLTDTLYLYSSSTNKYLGLHDLQLYQINNIPKLFYTGIGNFRHSTVSSSDYPSVDIATIPSTNDSAWASITMRESGTTKPSVVYSKRDFDATSSATHTVSITVPSGTNTCLTVIAYNSSGSTATGVTYNGVAMTSRGTATGTNASVIVYTMVAPTAGTYNVIVTWSASSSNRLMYAIVTDQTDQTNEISLNSDTSATATTITSRKRLLGKKHLLLHTAYSDEVLTFTAPGCTSVYDTTNTYGSDFLYTEDETGLYLQIGVADLPLTSATQNEMAWISYSASGGGLEETLSDFVFMRRADNGFMYVFADHKVKKIDGMLTGGINGSINDVLIFPKYFQIVDAVDYRSNLYICINQQDTQMSTTSLNTFSGKCGIYIWDRDTSKVTDADFIELAGVREIKRIYQSPDSELRLITIGHDGLTQLRQFGYNDSGGVVFPIIKLLGIGGFPQYPDGLTVAGEKVIWQAQDGTIYADKKGAVTQLYQIKTPGTTSATTINNIYSGAILFGTGDETGSTGYRSNKQAVTFSYLDGSTHYIKKIYPFSLTNGSNSTQSIHQGDVYTGVTFLPPNSVLKNIRIFNIPTSSSADTAIATVKIYFNQSSTVGMTKTVTLKEASRGYIDLKINKPYIHALQLEIEWDNTTTLGVNTYFPSTAVISYEPTKGQSPDGE